MNARGVVGWAKSRGKLSDCGHNPERFCSRGWLCDAPPARGLPRGSRRGNDLPCHRRPKSCLSKWNPGPEEDQEELARYAREIEARRRGVYTVDEEEEAAIRRGLAELDRGEWVSEEEMRSFWKRCGVL